jgi:hypothetical protein
MLSILQEALWETLRSLDVGWTALGDMRITCVPLY